MKIPYYQLSRNMFICLFSTHWLFGGVTVRYWIFQKSEPIFWRQFFWGPASFIQRSYESLNPISSNQNTWSIQTKKQHPPPAIIAAPGCRQRTEGFVGPCVGVEHLQAPIIRSPKLGNIKDLGQHPWNCSKWRDTPILWNIWTVF